MIPVLRVESVAPYLPPVLQSVSPHPLTELDPERVWVPVDQLPDVEWVEHRHDDEESAAWCETCRIGATRPLGVGDVVHLAERDGCTRCGRSPYIRGRAETVFMASDGFHHGTCDDRWDPAAGARATVAEIVTVERYDFTWDRVHPMHSHLYYWGDGRWGVFRTSPGGGMQHEPLRETWWPTDAAFGVRVTDVEALT